MNQLEQLLLPFPCEHFRPNGEVTQCLDCGAKLTALDDACYTGYVYDNMRGYRDQERLG